MGDVRAQPRRADPRQAVSDEERDEVFAAFGPDPRCSSTVAACGAGCRRCSTATRGGSGWSTACCSPCRAPRCSSTARRSGWARTSTSTGGSPYARRCSGPPTATAASPAPGPRLRRPVAEGGFGPEHVNVADQLTTRSRCTRSCRAADQALPGVPGARLGRVRVLDQPHAQVLAHECRHDDRRLVAVHNLAPKGCTVPLTLEDCAAPTTSSTCSATTP